MEKIQLAETWTAPVKRKSVGSNDLDDFQKSFDHWQNFTESLMKEKSKLQENVNTLSHDKQKLVSKNEELENQIDHLQTVLDFTHKSLHRICDVEEENREVKANLERLKADIEDSNLKMDEKERQHLRIIEEITIDNEKQKEEVKNSMKILLENENERNEISLRKKNSEVEELKEKLQVSSRESEAEIVRVSMEYEGKLAKLRQKLPSSTAHGSSTNQEIFRMKLQHMKNEYEREVRLLKEQVSELEERETAHPGGNRMTFTTSKKRRF
ncbi:unnamed protein product [Mytilus coruscus]|uniref:Uncharacterized protein n=1 Tax=Mytilus coruscus TaxID=42192 RepID=A0A6J8EHV1_MYTCO|nr:unnamed protein product [Mytilus coruscus]